MYTRRKVHSQQKLDHKQSYIYPGQLSLAIPPWVGIMSTSQKVVMLCSWGVKAGMVREWVTGKTVWSPCYHGPYLSALAMGSSHNRVLYKCPTTLLYFTYQAIVEHRRAHCYRLTAVWSASCCGQVLPVTLDCQPVRHCSTSDLQHNAHTASTATVEISQYHKARKKSCHSANEFHFVTWQNWLSTGETSRVPVAAITGCQLTITVAANDDDAD